MFRNALIASVIALGAAGVAQAQDAGPRLIGGGDDAQLVYSQPSRNIIGGGAASMTGGGEDRQIAYGRGTTTGISSGLVAELVGGGDNAQLVYHRVAPSASVLAGRPDQRRG